jgi:nucleoside-diphosphate-sugar epimerase
MAHCKKYYVEAMNIILITGSRGSMAHYLTQYLFTLNPRPEVYGIERAMIDEREFVPVRDYIRNVLATFKPTIIFHLAANAHVQESFKLPQQFIDSNVLFTQTLIDSILLSEQRPTLLIASTSEVYGNVPKDRNPIKETEPFAPINPYACTKAMQEHLALCYLKSHNIPCVITRAFGYINPRRSDLVATNIAKQLIDADHGRRREIHHGNLRPIRTFCDVRDIAEAYWIAATKGEVGEAYNIGSTEEICIGDLILALYARSSKNVSFVEDAHRIRPTDIEMCIPDMTKFEVMSGGWKPKIPLTKSLDWLMNEMRQS